MRRLIPLALVVVMSLALATPAMAAPTASQISTPSDPSFPDFDYNNPTTMTVAGTASGGSGNVDVRCYTTAGSKLISSNVTVAGGSFDVNILQADVLTGLGWPYPYCVLRAVPTGTTPADPSPFQGPHIGAGYFRTYTLGGNGGGVNPPDTVDDYYVTRSQSAAYNDYNSAGSCGLCDSYLFNPATGDFSNVIWWANAALYREVPGTSPKTRSAVRVDGVDAYNPSSAYANAPLRDNPGFPALTYSHSTDPVTGDLTIEETDPFVSCSPQPAVYPANDVSCASLDAPKVRLVRTLKQQRDGLQVTIVDRWQSRDGLAHELDAYYDQTVYSTNFAKADHTASWNFPWTGDGFTEYPPQTTIPAAPGAPATYYVKEDATTPDGGDGSNPIGAVTLGTVPDELIVRNPSSASYAIAHWQEHYTRTIPATGDLKIEYAFSHDYSLASVQSLAHDAEQALGATGAGPAPSGDGTPTPPPPPVAAPPAATPPPAPAAGPPTKCVVPRLHGKTLRRSKILLRRAHCRLGRVTRKPSTRVKPGRAVSSRPRAGSGRPAGTRVRLVLAR